ncbi:hypothetical protein Tco_0200071 [Tanacetum coccineum]
MVISSPCLTDIKNWLVHSKWLLLASSKQMTLGKDFSNPLIVDSLLNTIWLSMHHVIAMKQWIFQSKRLLNEINTEFMPPEDDVLPAEEQPLPAAVSPTADSPSDYPDDRDDDDEEEEESSGDDADDDEDDEEEDEHIALADSIPPPTCRTTARISIRDQTPIPFPPAAEVDRFLTISTPPPSPLTSYSSPLPHIPSPPLPVSSPLPVSPPPLPASPTYPLGYRAAMIWFRVELPSTSHLLPLPSPIILPHTRASVAMMRFAAPSTYILASRSETPLSETPPLLPIPLPTSSPPLLFPSTVFRASVCKVTLPPRKRLCIALGLIFEVGKSSSAPTAGPTRGFRSDYGFVGTLDAEIRRDLEREVGYGITDTWDEMVEDMQGTQVATDVAGLSQQMTDFIMTVRQDTDEIYMRLNDAKDDRNGHPKESTRSTPATTTTPTTSVTNEQLKRLVEQVVADALAARDADRSQNGKDSHGSGTGVRRQAPLARECTYPDFMKCKPLYFKGTEGVVELT